MEVQGGTEPGFEAVREAFEANFERHREVGAACCVYRHGRKVVDLWAGVADAHSGRMWDADTLQLVFSATKGATAICALRLAERGELDLDAPVVEYWPEFGAAGKQRVPVRWLLSHRSGLPVVDTRADTGRCLRVATGRQGAGRPASTLGTRDRPWIPRPHLRLSGR